MFKSIFTTRLKFLYLIVPFFILAFVYHKEPTRISLDEAIKQKLVTLELNSTGNYRGNSVVFKVQNQSTKPLHITIPAGNLYHPDNEDEQTLLQLQDDFIVVNPNEKAYKVINAFCTESGDGCPTKDSGFTLAKSDNNKFNKLIAYLKDHQVNPLSIQPAVWAISDNRSISHLSDASANDKEFRSFMSEVTGQKNTWYSSPQEVDIDPYGNFVFETVKISGELEFDCRKGVKIYQDVYKEDGEMVMSTNQSFTPLSDHLIFRFNLAVRGWEKGDYYVKVHTGNRELSRFEFSI